MPRKFKPEFTLDELKEVVSDADMIKNNTSNSTINSTNNNSSDITSLVDSARPKYIDTRSRITPYIDSEVLQEFKDICGHKKGLQSEIIEKLLIQFIADVKAKR